MCLIEVLLSRVHAVIYGISSAVEYSNGRLGNVPYSGAEQPRMPAPARFSKAYLHVRIVSGDDTRLS